MRMTSYCSVRSFDNEEQSGKKEDEEKDIFKGKDTLLSNLT